MARRRTMVVYRKPHWNEKTRQNDYTDERYWLLHWGLQSEVQHDNNNNPIVMTYTVAICHNIETDEIETFLPAELKILGSEQVG